MSCETLSNLLHSFCQRIDECKIFKSEELNKVSVEINELNILSKKISTLFRETPEEECDFPGFLKFKSACRKLEKTESKVAESVIRKNKQKIDQEQKNIKIQLDEEQKKECRQYVSSKYSQIERRLDVILLQVKEGYKSEQLLSNFTDIIEDLNFLKLQLMENKVLPQVSVEYWLGLIKKSEVELAAFSETIIS